MDAPKRYSDEVPYEKRRYWYFTLHGIGPGTIPKDLHVLESREGKNDKGTLGLYICLDGILNTSELKEFDLKELTPSDEDLPIKQVIENYLRSQHFTGFWDVWISEENEVHIHIEHGDWKHQHSRCKYLMNQFGYDEIKQIIEEPIDDDCYSSIHVYVKQ